MDKAGSSQKWVGKFEVDSTTRNLDWIGKTRLNDEWKLTEWTGIYELKGDELKLCFIFDRDELAKRPTEFKSLPPAQRGLAHAFYTFKRVEEERFGGSDGTLNTSVTLVSAGVQNSIFTDCTGVRRQCCPVIPECSALTPAQPPI